MPFLPSGRYGAPEVATAPVALSMDEKLTVMTGSLVKIND